MPVPLKRLCSRPPEYGLNITPDRYQGEGVRLLRTSDLAAEGQLVPDGGVYLDEGDVPDGMFLEDGDMLFSRSGTVGRAFLYDRARHGRATFAGFLVRFRLDDAIDARAVRYWSESAPFAAGIESGAIQSTIMNFNAERYAALEVPDMVVRNSRGVADYLDAETARIDAIIGLRRRQLDLLGSQLVEASRGAFREMAGTVRLDWMPPLPREWPIVHLRWLVACLDGRRIPVNREERVAIQGDVPYWGANGVVDHVNRALFDEPLVLLGEDGAPFLDRLKEKAFYVDGPIWPNNHIHVLRPTGIRPKYLAHYLNLVDYAAFIEGSTRDKLTQDPMGSIPVPVPPDAEQERIEKAIAEAQVNLELRRSRIARQVQLLYERRQAVITAAVTGELDIPQVAA